MSFLTQAEADALLALEKHYIGNEQFKFPSQGDKLKIELYSADKREAFSLDITSSIIKMSKNSIQTRAQKVIVLARVDIDGPPHRNPDNVELECPHLHLYKEGYGDKWAVPLPDSFTDHTKIDQVLSDFMDYCNIQTRPDIVGSLLVQ